MNVTAAGITRLVRALHPPNALLPMRVSVAGSVRPVRPPQPASALSPMVVTPAGIATAPVVPAGHATTVCPFAVSRRLPTVW